MIIKPRGEITSGLTQGQGIICTQISGDALTNVRTAMPLVNHNQLTTKMKLYE